MRRSHRSVPKRRSTPKSSITDSLRLRMLHVLVLVDLLLIAVHLVVAMSPDEESWAWSYYLRIDTDRSISEWFESAKLATAALLLVRYAPHHRTSYLIVAALLASMLFDNLFEVREYFALLLAPDAQANGELALVAAAAPFIAGLAYFTLRRSGPEERSELAAIGIVLAAFALFSVAIDFLHEFTMVPGSTVYGAMSVFEDGGELVVLSVLLGLVVHLTRKTPVRLLEATSV
jgi:hypothetical protein